MKSINFEYLRAIKPELSALGGFAESYAYSDPASSLVKLRQLLEIIVYDVYEKLRLTKPYQPSLNDLLNEDSFKKVTPAVILNKIHAIRIQGNKAAHGERVDVNSALMGLQESFDLCRWLYVGMYKGDHKSIPSFKQPPKASDDKQTQSLNKKLKEKLSQQEAEIQALLDELETQQEKYKPEEKTPSQEKELLSHNLNIVSELAFDEARTRKQLIDVLFAEADWPEPSATHYEGVSVEYEVDHQPTNTGKGYVDYVMWDDKGLPIAILEAKKTSVSAEKGKQQARIYADGLEKEFKQRPVIFYSNGFETYIWNDAANEPPRRIYGLYSYESLKYLLSQRTQRKSLSEIKPNPDIAGRGYQLQAIKSVCEEFSKNRMKALIVQATGTGKTRVAISLCDVMVRAGWAKRALFLCDRRELRKQANNAFREFLPSEPRIVVSSKTNEDKEKRIYLATYPSMMECYQNFDVGFFDLIIADESHRSIYNRYRDLFLYFDARQVGLTATPKNFISHNTYKVFGCEEENPTFFYSYEQAIEHIPPYLCEFEVVEHSTKFLRDGIKYKDLSEEQKRQLEEQLEDAEEFEADKNAINKQIFNKDTNRAIIKNLMENGIRDASGNSIGKTIIFARSHDHAALIERIFSEMYPQYGDKQCVLIDNTLGDRAEVLIDEFKDPKNPLKIAVSVDMLDTGIDVPEVVNLVFAKPVKSYVKFWQMIGRGTRLCEDLLGPGKDKEVFRIFDHWKNFEYFDEHYKPKAPVKQKSLLEKLFLSRIMIAEQALSKQENGIYKHVIDLIARDIAALPETSISIKEKWHEIKILQHGETLKNFSAATIHTLKNDIAPLMQWRDSRGQDEAFSFDCLIAKAQGELLKGSADFEVYKDEVIEAVSELPINLNQVRAKLSTIQEIKTSEFWQNVPHERLEKVRTELRGLMKHRDNNDLSGEFKLPIIDVTEDLSQVKINPYKGKRKPQDLIAYRKRVTEVLADLFEKSPVLNKIKKGEAVSNKDIEDLTALVLSLHPDVNLQQIAYLFPQHAGNVEALIRSVIGLEPAAVSSVFESFMQQHPELSSKQMKFLELVQNHIAKNGSIKLEKLYEPPFTALDAEGLDGVFPDASIADQLIVVLEPFLAQQQE